MIREITDFDREGLGDNQELLNKEAYDVARERFVDEAIEKVVETLSDEEVKAVKANFLEEDDIHPVAEENKAALDIFIKKVNGQIFEDHGVDLQKEIFDTSADVSDTQKSLDELEEAYLKGDLVFRRVKAWFQDAL